MYDRPLRVAGAVLGIGLVLAAGCGPRHRLLEPEPSSEASIRGVELTDTPFFAQTDYHCGPASLAALLGHSGISVKPVTLAPAVYLPGKRGSLQIELVAATRRFGRIPYPIRPAPPALLAELNAGRPVLVLLNLGWRRAPVWHYAVVVGYDTDPERLILRSGTVKRKTLSAAKFLKAWKRADQWGLVALKPGQLPADDAPDRYLRAVAGFEAVGDGKAAWLSYRAAAARWPDNPMVRFGLGNALYALDRSMEAEQAFRDAVRLDGNMASARNNLAHILAARGCATQALAEINAAISLAPEAPDIQQILCQTRKDILARLHTVDIPGDCPGPVPATP